MREGLQKANVNNFWNVFIQYSCSLNTWLFNWIFEDFVIAAYNCTAESVFINGTHFLMRWYKSYIVTQAQRKFWL